ncbi:SNF2-related protein [Streptomyces sp. NPDC004596]|uniref:SNF2-related protein n=1 Tax=Streptomyces sp. DSM 118148 TaxID=3448667 RepID=UPI004040010B
MAIQWVWTHAAVRLRDSVARGSSELDRLLATDISAQSEWPTDIDLASLGFVRDLRPFQRVAVARLLSAGGGANFSVPGSGKTTVAYAVFTALRSRGLAQAMLVVAPPSAFEAWAEESEACFADGLGPVVAIRPDIPARRDTVVVLNYERLGDAAIRAELAGWARNRKVLTVFDEAHRAKAGAASRRGSEAAALAHRSDSTMVLTGTPMPNKPSDLEAVFDLVWPGQGARLVHGDLSHLRERAYVRATKDDLDLPPLDVRVERIALDGPHRVLYDAMTARVSEWASAARDSSTIAAEAGRALMHLIAAATNPAAVFAPDRPWSVPFDRPEFVDLHSLVDDPTRHVRPAKIVRAAQLVAENRALGRKTVVWSSFVANITALSTALNHHNPAVITGATAVDDATAPTDRRRQLSKFRRNDDCWALIATPQTLGEGVSLHHTAIDQVHVDRGYSAGTWLQAIDRTHRLGLPPGSRPTCTVLIAEDTIDERVTAALNAKVAALAIALNDHTLLPVADPTMAEGDSVAAVLGDVDALWELLGPRGQDRSGRETRSTGKLPGRPTPPSEQGQ